MLEHLLESTEMQAMRYRFIACQNSHCGMTEFVRTLARRDEARARELIREGIEPSHSVIRDCLLRQNATRPAPQTRYSRRQSRTPAERARCRRDDRRARQHHRRRRHKDCRFYILTGASLHTAPRRTMSMIS